jgi:hypothetical protein
MPALVTTIINSFLLTFAVTLLYTPSCLHHASAQSTAPASSLPIPVSMMGYATTRDQKTFYIQGGTSRRVRNSNQFYSLDLTQPSWNTSYPPWKVLPVGAGNSTSSPMNYGLAMAISNDNNQLMEWNLAVGVSTYDVQKGTWIGIGNPGMRAGSFGSRAATDPDTGLVYIPGIARDKNEMLVYDFATKTTSTAPMPPPELLEKPVDMYAWAWNDQRQSMLLHGGAAFVINYNVNVTTYGNPNLLEFIPSMAQWKLVVRSSECYDLHFVVVCGLRL